MAIEITVPRLGWSSDEGIFAGWLKQDGDSVAIGEPLFTLESEKVNMDVESLDAGTLQILRDGPELGGLVKVGQVLGYLLSASEPSAGGGASSRVNHPQMVVPERTAPQAVPLPEAPYEARRLASPRARAKAKSLGIDISTINLAPGAHRIVEADVIRAASAFRARKVTARRLEESFRAPHFYLSAEVDATELEQFLQQMRLVAQERNQVRPTYNDLIVKAAALALRAAPKLNCFWNQGEIVARETIDVGLAVQSEGLLVVPVIRRADALPVAEISTQRAALVDRSSRSELTPRDVDGGSITISNLGPYGVDRFQAILNPPQSAIIAVGRIAKRPFVAEDTVVARLTMPLSLSVDHRVVDGVAAAEFLNALLRFLQSPQKLLT